MFLPNHANASYRLFKDVLQTSFVIKLTCLVPTEGNPEVGRPERLDLHQMLFYVGALPPELRRHAQPVMQPTRIPTS
jgi:hypothetical protein